MENGVDAGLLGQIELIGHSTHLPYNGEGTIEPRRQFERSAVGHSCLPVGLETEVNHLTKLKFSFRPSSVCIFFHALLSMLEIVVEN